MISRRTWFGIVGALVGILLLLAVLLLGGRRGAVDWTTLRAAAFESDDWGLAGFIPDEDAWEGLDRRELGTGRFPEIYWNSTLEDSGMVARLCDVLAEHRGRDGRPAILQPNYIMSSLGYAGEPGKGRWVSYDWPEFPPEYSRPGLAEAVAAGIASGNWYPELHGRYHYDPAWRIEQAFAGETAARATVRGIMLFPGSEKARELGRWRNREELADELDHALGTFRKAFGRSAGSIIAPDYTWNGRMEELWQSRGLEVIQGKREQINPEWLSGFAGRIQKFLLRNLDRFVHPGRRYLERNCRFEPVQAAEPATMVTSCLEEVLRAWRRGQPAIIETHRINFVHTDPSVVAAGRGAFGALLRGLDGNPGGLPLYLTDHEIAQLESHGVSWAVRGGVIVIRNYSRSRKILSVPPAACDLAYRQAGLPASHDRPLVVAVESGVSFDLVPVQQVGFQKIKR